MDKAPDKLVAGVTPGYAKLRVVEAATGDVIQGVREADAIAGTVTRTKVDESGNLVREGDAFVTETVTRPIRIEWIGDVDDDVHVPGAAPAPEPEAAANGPTQPVLG